MTKGFFITLTQKKNFRNPVINWRADLSEKIPGWDASVGGSLEEVLEFQKSQYISRQLKKQNVPKLVSNKEGPMASGKITRFVEIE